ncbi:YHS domain-containing protein [Burkholderia pseudomultivorans]|uniref:YHS domain-containing protein n=1 Tax=Burkholderia pseudomultivorans TaxID=1207504 RepID=UPI0018901001|nr:YHS domain-containing protein [Burkholderia pseudomultivorans]MBF5008687.1 YHS domain-containing protein [Burkholderia pseudomultivorans]
MDWITQNLIWILVGGLLIAMLWRNRMRSSRSDHEHHSGQEESNALNDPVTGNRVDPAHAITAEYAGRTFFFESENSRSIFQQNPSRFTQRQHHHHHGGSC